VSSWSAPQHVHLARTLYELVRDTVGRLRDRPKRAMALRLLGRTLRVDAELLERLKGPVEVGDLDGDVLDPGACRLAKPQAALLGVEDLVRLDLGRAACKKDRSQVGTINAVSLLQSEGPAGKRRLRRGRRR